MAGIILYHAVEHFDVFTQESVAFTLPCDGVAGSVLAWLLSGKMYGIFAMLFGLSFFIMKERHRGSRPFAVWFAWRMCLLFLFGLVDVAFYDGDILMLYAVYGLLLIPVGYLPSPMVWCIIGVLAIQPVELFCLLTHTSVDHSRLFDIYGQTLALHEHGTFWENAANNLRYGFELNLRYNIFSGRLTQLLCLFILGMQLGRHHLFHNSGRNLRIWHGISAFSAAIVVALSFADLGVLKPWLMPVYNLCVMIMIVAAVVSLWYASTGVRGVLHHLCIFGRMSLTHYLLQSVIGCFVFYGYGLACYRLVGTTYAALIGMAMVAVQYVFCRYWFRDGVGGKGHQRGPLEGLWRRMTNWAS